jgi:hypothetical protein
VRYGEARAGEGLSARTVMGVLVDLLLIQIGFVRANNNAHQMNLVNALHCRRSKRI